jgi:hypothetical protein
VAALETSHPPVYHLPADDVRTDLLEANPRRTFYEFNGEASYADLRLPDERVPAAGLVLPVARDSGRADPRRARLPGPDRRAVGMAAGAARGRSLPGAIGRRWSSRQTCR